ncbi:MAG: hypothetical protein V7742_21290 [Halioglobus sp.]
MTRIFGYTLLLILITGCESDYDKCLSAESAKLEAAVRASDPLYSAVAAIKSNRAEMDRYWETEVDVPERDCSEVEYVPDPDYETDAAHVKYQKLIKECFEENRQNVTSAYDAVGLAEEKELFGQFTGAMLENHEKTGLWGEWGMAPRGPEKNDGAEQDKQDLKGFDAAIEIADSLLKQELDSVPSLAREVCNSHGLYE